MTVDLIATNDRAIKDWVAVQPHFVIIDMLHDLIAAPLAGFVCSNTLEPQQRALLIELLIEKRRRYDLGIKT